MAAIVEVLPRSTPIVFGVSWPERWRLFRWLMTIIGVVAVPIAHSADPNTVRLFWTLFLSCGLPLIAVILFARHEVVIDLKAGTVTDIGAFGPVRRERREPLSEVYLVRVARIGARNDGSGILVPGVLTIGLLFQPYRRPIYIAYGSGCTLHLPNAEAAIHFAEALAAVLGVRFQEGDPMQPGTQP